MLNIVGLWKKIVRDSQGDSTTLLTLRLDGTYSKDLAIIVTGPYSSRRFGGIHDGTWSIDGHCVRLSGGDGWPPSTEDLRQFQRIG
jgi:hypothetical protein